MLSDLIDIAREAKYSIYTLAGSSLRDDARLCMEFAPKILCSNLDFLRSRVDHDAHVIRSTVIIVQIHSFREFYTLQVAAFDTG